MTDKATRTRKWTSKTRTGCRTCRERRIKCDETRPACMKCQVSSRTCGGYEIPTSGRSGFLPLVPRNDAVHHDNPEVISLPVLPYGLNSAEMQAFDFFCNNASNNLSGHFSSSVFQYLIPQVSHREPVVLNALIAVASIYRTRLTVVQSSLRTIRDCPMYQLALKQYNRAISNLSTYIESSNNGDAIEKLTVVLITCLLFVCFEMLQGDQAVVLSHLVTGLKILFEQSRPIDSRGPEKRILTIRNSSSNTIDELSQVFVRLDADSTMFGRRAPYLCPRSFGRFLGSELDLPSAFESVEEARAHLDTLTSITFGFRGELLKLAEGLVAISDGSSPDWPRHYCMLHAAVRQIKVDSDPQLAVKKIKLLGAFEAWSSSLSALDQCHRRQALLMLRIQRFYPWFIISTLQDTRACLCDRFQDVFRDIVNLVSQYVEITSYQSPAFAFALEPGITASLYLIGIKCREPVIRRQAIDFLRKSTVQEGLWNRKLFALYCQRFMDLEEQQTKESLNFDGPVRYIPEQARYGDVVFGVDSSTPDVGRLVCARYAFETDGNLEIVERRFSIST